ncbi:MAG: hypothetical protein JSU94_17635 [Phycisphaerales bacterium]|nr:MAG: hypothetical protein JSU94_17635 [Phycisphaerales bacterium]
MKEAGRFVIQRHARKGRPVHWDLMLETASLLRTYRLDLSPQQLMTSGRCVAVRIFDHSPKFLTYEGPVNQGRGTVEIADAGTYQLLDERPDRCRMLLQGGIAKGAFTLTLMEADRWDLALLSPQ